MFDTIYLHIGLQKTGTTAIQQTLWKNRDNLREQGFLYPSFLGTNHTKLALFTVEEKGLENLKALNRIDDHDYPDFIKSFPNVFFEKIKEEVNSSKERVYKLILSNEHLSARVIHSHEVKKIHDLLKAFSSNTVLIIYLRRQDNFALSLYSQAVKGGTSLEFHDWYEGEKVYWDWYTLISLWSSVFGKEKVIIRIYDDIGENKNVVDDFFDAVEISKDGIDLSYNNVNKALGFIQIQYLRILNQYMPRIVEGQINEKRQKILSALQQQKGESMVLSNEEREKICSYFLKNNSRLAVEYLGREILFSEVNKITIPAVTSLTLEQSMEITAKIFSDL